MIKEEAVEWVYILKSIRILSARIVYTKSQNYISFDKINPEIPNTARYKGGPGARAR